MRASLSLAPELTDTRRVERRTATPVLRSRTVTGRDRRTPGCSFSIALVSRATDSSRSTSPRPSRPSHDTHTIASSVTTAGGTSQSRISTQIRVGRSSDWLRKARERPSGNQGSLRRADPLLGAVGERLVLPDRHLVLQGVDQCAGGLEGLAAVARRGGADDGDVADGQRAGAMDGGQRGDVVRRGDLGADVAQLVEGRGCAEYSSPVTSWPPSWSRTRPTKTVTPPDDASSMTSMTSATSSGVSLMSTRRSTSTPPA